MIGDFNSIVSTREHLGGSYYYYYYARKAHNFAYFISVNQLLDVGYTSTTFSWCIGQIGQAPRWARLDHCLVNAN